MSGFMAPDLIVHNICQGNKSSHLAAEWDMAVYLFGLFETNSVLVLERQGVTPTNHSKQSA